MRSDLASHWMLVQQLLVSAELSRVDVGLQHAVQFDMRLRDFKEAVKACDLSIKKGAKQAVT